MKTFVSLFSLFLLFSSPQVSADLIFDIDGHWEGALFPSDSGSAKYLFEMDVSDSNTRGKAMTIAAKTDYADLKVLEAAVSYSDVHSPTEFNAIMIEEISIPGSDYYHVVQFKFTGWIMNEETIEGYVTHQIDDDRWTFQEADFVLKRTSRPEKPAAEVEEEADFEELEAEITDPQPLTSEISDWY